VRDAVPAELDVRVLHYHVAQRVAERVVFVVELEGCGGFGGAGELLFASYVSGFPLLSFCEWVGG
jgi:hypothetical protein